MAPADSQYDFDSWRSCLLVLLSLQLYLVKTVIDLRCVIEIVFALQVVIYEALMLLKDRCQDTGVEGDDAASSSSSSREAALKFIEAVSNTKSLSLPEYINLSSVSRHHRC